MFKPMLHATLVCSALVCLCGCLPDGSDSKKGAAKNTQVQATPGQIVDQIKRLSADPETNANLPDRHILAQQLAQMGPTALGPLVDFMGAPDTAPNTRLFILQCVTDHLSMAYMANLKPLIESPDQVVRAIGIMALAHIQDPAVVPLLTIARKDVSPHVSLSALSGLTMHGDLLARQEMREMYSSGNPLGDIRAEDVKREVVRVLLRDATAEDLAILKDALNQPFLAINSRFMIAETFGRLGDKSVIPLLEQSVNLQKEPEYGEMVKQAIASINERQGHA